MICRIIFVLVYVYLLQDIFAFVSPIYCKNASTLIMDNDSEAIHLVNLIKEANSK